MAKVTLLGIQELDFDTNDGKNIKGIKLHVYYPDNFVYGFKADTKFISDDSVKNLRLNVAELKDLCGTVVNIETSLGGKIVGISAAE